MARLYGVYIRILFGIIVLMLPFILTLGLDIKSTLLISFGFGTSISLWSLSSNYDQSALLSHSKKMNSNH